MSNRPPWMEDEEYSSTAEDASTEAAADLPQKKTQRGRGLPSLKDLGKSVAGGFLGSVEAGLEGIDWLGDKLGVKGTATEEAAAGLRQFREENLSPEVSNILTDIASGVGSLGAFLVPGGLAARMPLLLARGAQVSAAAMKWAEYAGIASSSALEALAEAGSVYRENLTAGKTQDEAEDASTKVFFKNMALLGVTNKLSGFFEAGGKSLKRAMAQGFVFEGTQEAGQSVISQQATGDGSVDLKEAAYEGLIGGIVGGGAGGVISFVDKNVLKADEKKPGNVTVDSDALNSGMTQEQLDAQLFQKDVSDRTGAYSKWAQDHIDQLKKAEADAAEKAYMEDLERQQQQKALVEAEYEADQNKRFVDDISTKKGVMDVTAQILPELLEGKDAGLKRIGNELKKAHRTLWMGDNATTAVKERIYEIEQIEQKIPNQHISMVASRLKEELFAEYAAAEQREAELEAGQQEEAEEGISRAKQYQRSQAAVDETRALENQQKEETFDEKAKATRQRMQQFETPKTGTVTIPTQPRIASPELIRDLNVPKQAGEVQPTPPERQVGTPEEMAPITRANREIRKQQEKHADLDKPVSREKLRNFKVKSEEQARVESGKGRAKYSRAPGSQGRIMPVYEQLKSRLGYSNVPIADLRDALGISQEEMSGILKQASQDGDAVLTGTGYTTGEAMVSERDAGAAIDLDGQKMTHVRLDSEPKVSQAKPVKPVKTVGVNYREKLRKTYGYARVEDLRSEKAAAAKTPPGKTPYRNARQFARDKQFPERGTGGAVRGKLRSLFNPQTRRLAEMDRRGLEADIRNGLRYPDGTEVPESKRAERLAELREQAREEAKNRPKYSRKTTGERVQAAAIRTPDGRVVSGVSHGFIMLDNPWLDDFQTLDDGFVTNEGRFISRKEAAKLHEDLGTDAAVSEDFEHLDKQIVAREAQMNRRGAFAYSKYQEMKGRFSSRQVEDRAGADFLAIKSVVKDLQSKAPKALKTEVVATQADLPAGVRPPFKQSGIPESVVQAVTKDDKVYIVAENVKSNKHAVRLWMHEQIGHHGLSKFMESIGVDPDKFLDWAHNVVKGDPIYKWVAENYVQDTVGKTEQEAARLFTEEVLARRAEKISPTKKNMIWDRIRTLINKFLEKIYGKTDPSIKMDKRDIDAILEGAYRYLTNQNLRKWQEFQYSDEIYKQWFRDIVQKYPDAVSWYENHQAVIKEVFGDDAPIFNALLSLTSVSAPVRTNAIWAVESYIHMWGHPKHKMPGGLFPNANRDKIDLFTRDSDGFVNALMNSDRVKVSEFLRGLLGDRMATVNDRWMYRIFYGDHLLSPSLVKEDIVTDKKTGKKRDLAAARRNVVESNFSVSENTAARHKLFKLARELSDEFGKPIYPRDVQAALWMHFSSREQGITPGQQWDYIKALNTPVSQSFINKWGLDKSKWVGPKKDVQWYSPQSSKTGAPKNLDLFTGKAAETLTPLQYLKMRMDEIGETPGNLSKLLKVGNMPEVSRLEEMYQRDLKKRGVEKVYSRKKPGAVNPLELGKGVHYRGVLLQQGDFLRPSGIKQNKEYSVYSASDIGNRIVSSTARNPYAPLVYFYEAGTKPETPLVGKPNRYNVDFSRYDIYDGIKDELGLKVQAREETKTDRGSSETNALARLVKDAGFDGFLVKNPYGPGRWVLMGQETAVDFVPADVSMGISDVVESIETLPQDAKELEKLVGERGAEFEKRIQSILKDYFPELSLDRLQPGVAQFPVATSNKMEIGGILRIRGPLPAVRAAAAMIGLQHSQRQVYVMHTGAGVKPNGKFFRYKVKRDLKSLSEVYDKIKAAGIPEFNLTVNQMSGSLWVEQYVWDGGDSSNNKELVDKLKGLMDDLIDRGHPGNNLFDIHSEILGDQKDSLDPESKVRARDNYREHLRDYFGRSKGNEIYEQGLERNRKYEEDLVGRNARKAGDQEGGPAEGLPPGSPPRYSKLPTPAQQEVLNHIGLGNVKTDAQAGPSLEMGFWDRTMTYWVDSLRPLMLLEKKVRGKILDVAESAYKSFSLLSNSTNTLRSLLYDGTPKFENGWIVVNPEKEGGLFTVVKDLGEDANDFFLWMTAKSAEEMRTKGLRKNLFGKNQKTGEYLNDAEVIQTLEDFTREKYAANKEKWDKARGRLREINKSVLDFAVKAGLISQEAREVWERDDYIPFFRVLEDNWIAGNPEDNLKAMFPKSGAPHIGKIHKLEGSAKNMGDPMMNLVNSYSFIINESLKNLARAKTLKLAGEAKMLMRAAPRDGKNVIAVRKNGEATYYKVSDPMLYDAMVEMESMTHGKMSDAMKILSMPKRLLTAGVTLAPAFRIANFVRDTLHTTAMQKSFVPVLDSIRGLAHTWRRSEQFKEFMSTGGGFGGAYHSRDIIARDQKRLDNLKKELAGKPGGFYGTARRILDFWDRVGDASENAARMGAYLRGVSNGMNKADAAYFAKDLLDFHRHGKGGIAMFLVRTVPFLNARLQGYYRLGRAATDPANRMKFLITGMLVATASAMLHSYNDGEDWYDELPKNEHIAYWHVPIPGGRLRIPKPFEFGIVAGAMPEAFMSRASGKWDDEELGDFFTTITKEVLRVDWPQFVKPLVVQAANRDPFTGAPVVPRGEENLEGPLQFGPRTSRVARELAKVMPEGLDSPRRIDKFADDVFGSMAFLVREFVDNLLLPHFGSYPEDPADRLSDHWLFGRFLREEGAPMGFTRQQDIFYRLLQEGDQALATLREYKKVGDTERYDEYLGENRARIRQAKILTKWQKKVSLINQRIKLIHRSSTLDAEEKRAKIDELLERRNDIFSEVVERFRG